MDQLPKALALFKDQGLLTSVFGLVTMISTDAIVLAPMVRVPDTFFAPAEVVTVTLSITLEVEQLTIAATSFFICEPSPSSSPIKRSRGGSLSPPVEGASSK